MVSFLLTKRVAVFLSVWGAALSSQASPDPAKEGSSVRLKKDLVLPSLFPEIRLGSAKAPLQLFLFHSLNCPYCREFKEKTLPTLMPWIESGKISIQLIDLPTNLNAINAVKLAWHEGNRERYEKIAQVLMETDELWDVPPGSSEVDKEREEGLVGKVTHFFRAKSSQLSLPPVCQVLLDHDLMDAKSCRHILRDEEKKTKILELIRGLVRQGINETPLLIVNNEVIHNLSPEFVHQKIENSLKKLTAKKEEKKT